jgi:surface polysaccharide O-acyltransferase-like enzyme
VDLIRTVAIVLVILLHTAIEPHPIDIVITPDVVTRWWTVNIYDSIARPCVPLFIMLSGALLLQPSKEKEPLGDFLKKRLSRIGLPLIFWGAIYFAWNYFVNNQPLTWNTVEQGIIWGPYVHFWFLYMLLGLYLITPLLRVLIAHADPKLIRYFLLLWLIGTSAIPLLSLFGNYSLNNNLFLLTGWIGYFILGFYLLKVQLSRKTLYTVLAAGFAWTIIGTYIITALIGGSQQYFFYDYFSSNVILASVSLFLILIAVPYWRIQNRRPKFSGVLHFISKNSLGIYLFHLIVLETLQKGYLGFKISLTTMNPIVEIPLATFVTLVICLLVFYPLKKVPYLNRLIG